MLERGILCVLYIVGFNIVVEYGKCVVGKKFVVDESCVSRW